jgi:RHS repeat-associated protein
VVASDVAIGVTSVVLTISGGVAGVAVQAVYELFLRPLFFLGRHEPKVEVRHGLSIGTGSRSADPITDVPLQGARNGSPNYFFDYDRDGRDDWVSYQRLFNPGLNLLSVGLSSPQVGTFTNGPGIPLTAPGWSIAPPVIYDVDGDSLQDIVYCKDLYHTVAGTDIYVGTTLEFLRRRSLAEAFDPPISLNMTANSSASVFWAYCKGNYPAAPFLGLAHDTIDIDGDGVQELLAAGVKQKTDLEPAKFAWFALRYSPTNAQQPLRWVEVPFENAAGSLYGHHMMRVDLNGDGLLDLAKVDGATGHVWLNTGNGSFLHRGLQAPTPEFSRQCRRVRHAAPIDYDADGRTDLLQNWDCQAHPDIRRLWYNVALSPNGDVTAFNPLHVPEIQYYFPDPGGFRDSTFNGVADLDNDGNADVFGVGSWYGKGAKNTLLNRVEDGVGNLIKVRYDSGAVNTTADCVGTTTATWPDTCVKKLTGLVSSHSEGLVDKDGNEVIERTFTYTYTNPRVSVTGHGWLGFDSRTITAMVPARAGISPVSRTTIEYEPIRTRPLDSSDGKFRHLYLFAGLPKTTTITHGIEDEPITPPLQTAPHERITEITNTWEERQSASGFPFPALTRRDTDVYERERALPFPAPPPSSTSRELLSFCVEDITPDEYGNTEHHTRDCRQGEDSEEIRETSVTYVHDAANLDRWLISIPQAINIKSIRGQEEQTQSWQPTFDDKGRLRFMTRAGAETYTIEYVPDVFGNVTDTIENVANEPTRTTHITYDSQNIFPATITNALNQTTQVDFNDRFGSPTTVVDPNYIVSQRRYDELGLLGEVHDPDGTSIYTYANVGGMERDAETPAGTIHPRIRVSVEREGTGGTRTGSSETELDNYGRVVRTKGEGFAGTPIVQERAYDVRGRLKGSTSPHAVGSPDILGLEYTYDELDRLSQIDYSDGRAPLTRHYGSKNTLRTEHQPWVSYLRSTGDVKALEVERTTDPEGKQNVIVTGIYGLVGRSIDGENIVSTAKTIHYKYAPFNRLKGMFHQNRSSGVRTSLGEFTYDAYGQQLTHTDLDTGTTTNTYNGFDELKTSVDENDQLRAYNYDVLGRLTSIVDIPGAATSWVYDQCSSGPCANAVGRLTEMISPATLQNPDGARVRYTYEPVAPGNRGLVERVDYSVDGSNYSVGFTYDDLGRTKTITYPTPISGAPIRARYHYDASGVLNGLDEEGGSTTTPIWRFNEHHEGQFVERETFGNGAVTNYTYVAARNWVETINTTIESQGGTDVVQQLGYTYYANGQLLDAVRVGLSTRYAYDALGRLESTLDNAAGTTTSTAYTYDHFGNLGGSTTRDSGGDVLRAKLITPLSGRPHLINTVGGNVYGYDDKGNLTSRVGGDIPGSSQTITYTPFDLPDSIQTFVDATQFEYTADEQRLVRRTVTAAATETMHFVGDLYRRVNTAGTTFGAVDEYFRLYAGGREVAQIVRSSSGTTQTRYLHADHQGSVDAISTDTGTIRELRYDVFGAPEQNTGLLSRTGYTGHQHDRDLGFIDMRGRMYDPLAGRFASADPIIQAPFFSQGLNRYAYVFNDPVNLTDPSGFQAWVGDTFYTAEIPSAISDSVYAGAGTSGAGAVGSVLGKSLGVAGIGVSFGINASTWSSLPWHDTPGRTSTVATGSRAGETSQATQGPSNAQNQNNGKVTAIADEPRSSLCAEHSLFSCDEAGRHHLKHLFIVEPYSPTPPVAATPSWWIKARNWFRARGAVEGAKAGVEALSASGREVIKNGLTRAGLEYQKHMGRGELPIVPGRALNSTGQKLLDGILMSPQTKQIAVTTGNFAGGTRFVGPQGIGATFDAKGIFRYFGRYP